MVWVDLGHASFFFAHYLIRAARCLSVPGMLSWAMLVSSSQIGVVEKLKERGKEISNDYVAEKMLDL